MAYEQTLHRYDQVIGECRKIFLEKSADYGTSWRVLRPVSITDQIMIKALRIRHIQQTGVQKIGDGVADELRGIVNYGIIALIQEGLPSESRWELEPSEATALYGSQVEAVRELMGNKNHDYGEAWRQMCQESFVDLILSKLQRIRRILRAGGKTTVSEGAASNFMDIVNYAVFALIMLHEQTET
jgi:hypothetical protein